MPRHHRARQAVMLFERFGLEGVLMMVSGVLACLIGDFRASHRDRTTLPGGNARRWDRAAGQAGDGGGIAVVDYKADLGLSGDAGAAAVEHARHVLVMASRAAGLASPIDGVTLSARDIEMCGRDASHARGLGFGGKLAIHPAQIAPIP